MKRVMRSSSGREIYGPKWQNTESTSSENEGGDDAVDSAQVIPNGAATNVADNEGETQASKGITRRGIISSTHRSMYKATIEGDCVAAEMLLQRDPKLASDEITQEGDRALHVAASVQHQEIVRKLVEKMTPTDLTLLDGNGYTACCYAAISGVVEIADLMIRKNPTVASARDRENKTPIYKAASRGNAKMVSYFLKSAIVEDLSTEEWFDILLVTIRRGMYDVTIEISARNEKLATMRNDEGTALHLLARSQRLGNWLQVEHGVMRQDMRLLAKNLWEGIQKFGEANVIELMKNPPILLDAAKVGNVELTTMLTHTYPDLVWHTDTKGYTIFHAAVKHRQQNIFWLIDEVGARKDLIAVSQDENGNNILHLAAELGPWDRWLPSIPTVRLQMETLWFEKVKAVVWPLCLEMTNKDGDTPLKLFLKEHKSLKEKTTTWTMNTADSCLLISTLIFSVVFAAAFAVPGGYNQDTGIPILFETNWFTCFIVFEALAMFLSAWSILTFSVIMGMADDDEYYKPLYFSVFDDISAMPHLIEDGLLLLSLSVFGAISAFMSAYFQIYVEERAALIKTLIVAFYIVIGSLLLMYNFMVRYAHSDIIFRKVTRKTLFKRHAVNATKSQRRWWTNFVKF